MIVNQITEPPFYLVGVFIHNLYVEQWSCGAFLKSGARYIIKYIAVI